MARRKKSKQKKFEQQLLYLLIILSILVFGLMTALILSQSSSDSVKLQSKEVRELLTGTPGVAGRSCGILSELEAKNFLPAQEVKGVFTNQPIKNKVSLENQDLGLHWSDSCRYVDPTNSNIYAELFIDTYSGEDEASADLRESLPKAGMIDEIENNDYDELYYSSGAWFARDGRVLIKVSANDGRSGDLKDFSNNVFTALTLQL
jgi:hypothetical protein